MISYEINHPFAGGIAVVARDASPEDLRAGRPLSGRDGRLFGDCLAEAGIPRDRLNLLTVARSRAPGGVFAAHPRDVLAAEVAELHTTLRRLKPRVIVALGAEAAHAVVPEWPDARRDGRLTHVGDIKRACDVEARRGYVFDSPFAPVVATVEPHAVGKTWVPWRMLLSYDLQRAAEVARDGLVRPTRRIEIVSSTSGCRDAVRALRRYRVLGADLENRADFSVACLGLAGEGGVGYVFPERYLDGAKELLGDASLTTVWANGIYDLYILKHLHAWDVRARVEDVQILWHACYPELAGAKEDRKKHRFTRKALAFLASMFTYDEWWKCIHEDSRVLMHDLSWRAIKDVNPGEQVWAFDEFPHDNGKRRWRKVAVLAKQVSRHEGVRISTTKGFIVVTPEHKLLVRTRGSRESWMRADQIKPGMTLRWVSEPCAPASEFDAGWLSGMADGEGSIRQDYSTNSGGAIAIAQKKGPVLDKVLRIAQTYGFDAGKHARACGVSVVYIRGGRAEWLRFLSLLRPERLVKNFADALEGKVFSTTTAEVTKVEIFPTCNMVDIATEAHTFIAEGFAVHNSYDFASDSTEQFTLNGRDVCITLDIWQKLGVDATSLNAWNTYEHERSLMWPCVDMLARGLNVNDGLRRERIAALTSRFAEVEAEANAVVLPLIEREWETLVKLDVAHLFEETEGVCVCCRHAKKKQLACWSCAGFTKAPSAKELKAYFGVVHKVTKAELEARLGVCRVCVGTDRETQRIVNLNSDTQQKIVLYEILKLPKKFARNANGVSVLKSDEATLKNLLGGLPT